MVSIEVRILLKTYDKLTVKTRFDLDRVESYSIPSKVGEKVFSQLKCTGEKVKLANLYKTRVILVSV